MRDLWLAALLLASGFWLAAPFARAEVYMWVDEHGVTHYTLDKDQVPAHLRGQIRDAAPVAAPTPPTSPGVREPEPAPAPAATAIQPPVETAAPIPPDEPLPLPPVDAGIEPGDSPEIASVKQQIAADRERIKQLLAEPGAAGEQLASNAELRETGERLARKQAELEGLRRESTP